MKQKQSQVDICSELKKVHRGDIFSIFKIYHSNKPIWQSLYVWISIVSTIIITISIIISKISFYNSIAFLCDQIINIMPNILGFNLGGYVLLMGLNSQSILNEVSEPNNDGYSFFQKQSSVFAMSILVQSLSVVLAFLFQCIMHFFITSYFSNSILIIINLIIFSFFFFICFYAILLIVKIVVNIFNFGQILHFFVRIENLEKQKERNFSKTFKIGSIVQLKSGGVEMTVKFIIGDNTQLSFEEEKHILDLNSGYKDGDVFCQWFHNKKLEYAVFNCEMLKEVDK
jgi:uncharacterized protein YodC (DUF2158 family)